jgi:N6-adenosine-specific RNA methylase IME4
MTDGGTVDDLNELVRARRRFGCIYADPPWPYDNQATRASTSNHYATMSLEDIRALPVGQLAAQDCHLHLLTTASFLFEALRVLEAWGFDYRGEFVWCKPQLGLGNYWRVSTEFLLLGVRGTQGFAPEARDLCSWAVIDRTKRHSSKPEKVRLWIERASPGPYLELFGRRAVSGWVVWGNEIERDLFSPREATCTPVASA